MNRPDYCPCENETPDPCPACGATVFGDDHVNGVCQAKYNCGLSKPFLELVLIDKEINEVVAKTTAYH